MNLILYEMILVKHSLLPVLLARYPLPLSDSSIFSIEGNRTCYSNFLLSQMFGKPNFSPLAPEPRHAIVATL